ncbi:MAG: hypothetical protein ABH821_00625 [archaeon]
MIKVIEALIAVALLFTVFFTVSQASLVSTPRMNSLQESIESTVSELALKQDFREKVSLHQTSLIKEELQEMIDLGLEVRVCEGLDVSNGVCYGSKPSNANTVVVNYLFEGNVLSYNPKVLQVYGWSYG